MLHNKIVEFSKNNFNLKALICGTKQNAFVIGSHIYYPRTFSDNLKTNLQLICADTRGFVPDNAYHKAEDFTLDKMVQDIQEMLISFGLDKIILIGHSIHAFMALEYAYRFPDKVSHLILIASSPIVGPELYKEADRYFEESVCPERKATFTQTMQKFVESNDQSFIQRMLAFGPRLWYNYNFDASKIWEDVAINSTGAGIIWGTIFENFDIIKVLKEIKCPIFLALGRYDYFNPPHLWEKYRDYISNFTVRIFEKSSHTPQLEEASNFDKELIEWLESRKY